MAFNAAFEELDLPYRWSEEEYGELLHVTGGQRRIDRYLTTQGVDASERASLAPSLHSRKTEILLDMVDGGRLELRPGAQRLLAELEGDGVRLAVATTGSRSWVDRLLRRLLPALSFQVVVTGDEVANRKPDPEAFVVALARLGVEPACAVAVEDSGEGLLSARGAGLRCAVVVNDYTADHDLAESELTLDGFGEPESPATVVSDPRDTGCAGLLTRATLEALLP